MASSAAEDDPQVAWREFCALLEQAGDLLQRDDLGLTDLDRAEGLRYLGRLLQNGLASFLENPGPRHPRFSSLPPHCGFGLDNPDNVYSSAGIDPQLDYRISGTRGTIAYLSFAAQNQNYAARDRITGGAGHLNDDDLDARRRRPFRDRRQPTRARGQLAAARARLVDDPGASDVRRPRHRTSGRGDHRVHRRRRTTARCRARAQCRGSSSVRRCTRSAPRPGSPTGSRRGATSPTSCTSPIPSTTGSWAVIRTSCSSSARGSSGPTKRSSSRSRRRCARTGTSSSATSGPSASTSGGASR